MYTPESLTKDVFERHSWTGSEAFSLFICLDAKKFVLLSFFSLIKRIWGRVLTKPLPNGAKVHFQLTSFAQKRCSLAPYFWKKKAVMSFFHAWSPWIFRLASPPVPCGSNLRKRFALGLYASALNYYTHSLLRRFLFVSQGGWEKENKARRPFPSSHRPSRAFYFLIVAIFIG